MATSWLTHWFTNKGASLADGRYTLTVLAGQAAGANGLLDGDGDGQSGGNFVLPGDPAYS